MLERMAVSGAKLGGEINVAAELQQAIVIALENGFGLFRSEPELLEVLRLVGLKSLAVVVLHQRHAEHVDAVALAGALGVEHVCSRNVVLNLRFASHLGFSRAPLRVGVT